MKRYVTVDPSTPILRLGGRPPRITTWLLVEQVAIFLVYAFANGPAWVGQHLAASGGSTIAGLQLYQPLTALWIHLGTRNLIYNVLILWTCGAALERWWGGRRFLFFWIVTGVGGLCLGCAVGLLWPKALLSGSTGSTLAMLAAVAFTFPRHLIFLYRLTPLKARLTCLVLGGIILLGDLIGGFQVEASVGVGGALCALAFLLGPARRGGGGGKSRRLKHPFEVLDGGKAKKEPKYWN